MSWYGEYVTVNRSSGSSQGADSHKKRMNSLIQKEHVYSKGTHRDAKNRKSNEEITVTKVTDENKTGPDELSRSGEGKLHLPNLGTSYLTNDNKTVPKAPPSTPETLNQGKKLDASNASRYSEDDTQKDVSNVKIKLPMIKITHDTIDRVQTPHTSSTCTNLSKTVFTSGLKKFPVHLPSLSSKQKHQPKSVSKHWRKRVTVSWSEGYTSRVIIEEEKRRIKSEEVSREKRHTTQEHLRRFLINERRELRKK